MPATRMRGTPHAPSCCASAGRSHTACEAPTWRSGSSPALAACADAQPWVRFGPGCAAHAQQRPVVSGHCGATGEQGTASWRACSGCVGEDALQYVAVMRSDRRVRLRRAAFVAQRHSVRAISCQHRAHMCSRFAETESASLSSLCHVRRRTG